MSDSEKKGLNEFKSAIKPYTLERLEKKPRENYVSILILRELKSAARFTTDGIEANSAVIRINGIEETLGKLFGRKQVASDRRKAKALQRTLITEEMSKIIGEGGWNGCTMKVNEMCQKCPECALFGSAASEEGISITSRAMYDEAYTIRALSAIVEEFFQNAPGDEYAKEPTPSIREPDFFKEGTLFPCVVTLKDVTVEEVLFFLNITDRNSRYGATGSRFGKTQNHLLGIYASHREGPSSLEVSKEIAIMLAKQGLDEHDQDYREKVVERLKEVMYRDTLSVDEIKTMAITAFESLSNRQRIDYLKFDTTYCLNILEDIRDDLIVKSILLDQIAKIGTFLSA